MAGAKAALHWCVFDGALESCPSGVRAVGCFEGAVQI